MRKLTRLLSSIIIAVSLLASAMSQPISGLETPTVTSNSAAWNMGPVYGGATYSDLYGWIFTGQYTQQIGIMNALSLILDGGPRQTRANLTWGMQPRQNQLFKVTAEYLRQKMEFNFLSGEVREWIGQPAIGAQYEYLLNSNIINDVFVGGHYSYANSKTLSPKDYRDSNGLIYENYRRIAGGRNGSGGVGVDLFPLANTHILAAVNYSDVTYDTKCIGSRHDERGIGGTVSLDQLLTKQFRVKLLAKRVVPLDEFQGGIYYQPTSQLNLGVALERIIGGSGLPNDSRVTVDINYDFAMPKRRPNLASLRRQAVAPPLRNWTAVPAIKMKQVLAVVDQKRVGDGLGPLVNLGNGNSVPAIWEYGEGGLQYDLIVTAQGNTFNSSTVLTEINNTPNTSSPGQTLSNSAVFQSQTCAVNAQVTSCTYRFQTVTGQPGIFNVQATDSAANVSPIAVLTVQFGSG